MNFIHIFLILWDLHKSFHDPVTSVAHLNAFMSTKAILHNFQRL